MASKKKTKKSEKTDEEKPEGEEEKKQRKKEIKSIAIERIAETNVDGKKKVRHAIRSVRGISFMLSNAISKQSGFGDKLVEELTEEEKTKLEDMIMHPEKFEIPKWLLNRRKDIASGNDIHLAVSELQFAQRNDIGAMRKLKTYKGIRHSKGLPVRGQRTRGSFRKNSTVGVSKKKEQPASKKKEQPTGKKK